MKVLLITPPMTQVNAPYPATAYLTAYLRECGHHVEQRDLGLDLFHRLFCRSGLRAIRDVVASKPKHSDREQFFLEAADDYENTIDQVVRFLKGKDPTLALRLSRRHLVPEGPRFMPLNENDHLLDLFGPMGVQDQAKYIASLYLDDIGDIIRQSVDPRFEFSRYGEELASSQASFTPLLESLKKETLVDHLLCDCAQKYIDDIEPRVVGFTLPFPGNVYGGLRAAAKIKKLNPTIVTVAGGGFVNTELRELSDPRIFDFFDYLIFDDGELPFKLLLEHLNAEPLNGQSGHHNGASKDRLIRTWFRENGTIVRPKTSPTQNVPFKELKGPTFTGLSLENYISMLEMPNPMHRMWSDFRWNKMILAHGCYWRRCTFCDTSLDYIQRYEPARIDDIVATIERVVAETGQTGFHFVDEAAPPALLKALSERLIEKKIRITWWGNLRFDKQFTPEVAQLMADAGCVAVTGGLEVACPRILDLIQKGTSVEQVARVTKAFTEAGIYVHAYLMYGFPTQTEQETVDSLEIVRQLFVNECLHSAHWHRFVATAHSPVGQNPEKFGIQLQPAGQLPEGLFAKNAIPFIDPTDCDHDRLGKGLRKAVYNYMHGVGIDENVRSWFGKRAPPTIVPPNFIATALG